MNIKEKLLLLQQRANKRRKNLNLRHMPNNHDIKIANDNFKDLEYEVYSNIDWNVPRTLVTLVMGSVNQYPKNMDFLLKMEGTSLVIDL